MFGGADGPAGGENDVTDSEVNLQPFADSKEGQRRRVLHDADGCRKGAQALPEAFQRKSCLLQLRRSSSFQLFHYFSHPTPRTFKVGRHSVSGTR